jgi:hypothetical protein
MVERTSVALRARSTTNVFPCPLAENLRLFIDLLLCLTGTVNGSTCQAEPKYSASHHTLYVDDAKRDCPRRAKIAGELLRRLHD